MFDNITQEIISLSNTKNLNKEDILNLLFENEELKQKFANEIRRSTVIWNLANKIFDKLNIEDNCKIMAIWDIEFFWELNDIWKDKIKKSLCDIDPSKLSFYDLVWLWSDNLKEKLFYYMDVYYNFPILKEKIINEIIPCYGSTDGFVMLLDTLKQKYNKANFIFPETSFLANTKISETYGFKSIKIDKPSENNFFISKEQIDNIYKNNNEQNIFYFTSVGNPTWEKIVWDDLYKIIKYIVYKDNKSIIILDNVYVWLLKKSISTQMFNKIFSDENIMNQIIFCESLSKTLWTTGIRIWFLWTLNKDYNLLLKRNITLKKAGFSKVLDQMMINLLSNLNEIIYFQNNVYDFISNQRINFMKYIKNNFSEFFDFDKSSSVEEREWIYILLKIKEWFTSQYIYAKTWIIWVEILLSDWKYIRYSFWNTNYF